MSAGEKKPRRRRPEVLWLRISLKECVPEVWRRVLVHSDTTLEGLHRVNRRGATQFLRLADGWGVLQ